MSIVSVLSDEQVSSWVDKNPDVHPGPALPPRGISARWRLAGILRGRRGVGCYSREAGRWNCRPVWYVFVRAFIACSAGWG